MPNLASAASPVLGLGRELCLPPGPKSGPANIIHWFKSDTSAHFPVDKKRRVQLQHPWDPSLHFHPCAPFLLTRHTESSTWEWVQQWVTQKSVDHAEDSNAHWRLLGEGVRSGVYPIPLRVLGGDLPPFPPPSRFVSRLRIWFQCCAFCRGRGQGSRGDRDRMRTDGGSVRERVAVVA
jgi:hypothetical protein